MQIPQLTAATKGFVELIHQSREFYSPPDRISTAKDQEDFKGLLNRGNVLASDLLIFSNTTSPDSAIPVLNDALEKVERARWQIRKFRQLFEENQLSYARRDRWITTSGGVLALLDDARSALEEIQSRKSPDGKPQQDAPSAFDVVNDRIVAVQPLDADIDLADAPNAVAARKAALERGRTLVEDLQRSNCDPRLIESLVSVQARLEMESGIIELGIAQIGLARIATAAEEELAPGIAADLRTQVTLISMYVAQFPRWRRFTENVAAVALDRNDVDDIGRAAERVADRLEAEPHLSDEETPRIIRYVIGLIHEPGEAGKRAAFALLRLIENIVAKVWNYSIDLINKTATKTIDGISGAAAKVAVAGFLALAATATANLAGVPAKIAEASWLQTAAQVAQAQLQLLAKSAS